MHRTGPRARRRLAALLALILILLLTTAGDWPTYLHDPQHTAASLDETALSPSNVPQLTTLWTMQAGTTVAGSPTIANGTVYAGSWDGYEYALDAASGALKWKTYLGLTTSTVPHCAPASGNIGLTSAPTVISNTVYVGGGDAYWYALDATTGNVLWKVYTGDNSATAGHYNWASPLIYNGYAYIGISSLCDNPLVQGQLIKVDLNTHQIVATTNFVPNGQVGGGIWTTPSVDPATNTIFVSTGTEGQEPPSTQPLSLAMVALDADTLAVQASWQVPPAEQTTDSDWGVTPILFNDSAGNPLVAAINKGGWLYTFNRNNVGAGPLWQTYMAAAGPCPTCGDSSVASGAFAQNTLYMAGGNTSINGISYPGSVRAFNPGTGQILWEHGAPDVIITSIAYANGFVVDGAGYYLEVLDAGTGARLYSNRLNGAIYSLSIANGVIYAGTSGGTLYALGLPRTAPTPTPTPQPDAACPGGWSCQDIGNPARAGSETVSSGVYTVNAGGTDIGGSADQFRFIAQPVSGDVQISAQVVSQSNTNAAAKAGLMVRQSSAANAPYYAAFLTPGNGLVVQYRTLAGGGTTTANISLGTAAPPLYLQIQRRGDDFVTATSSDGVNYTLVPGSQANTLLPGNGAMVIMPSSVLAGLAVTARSTTLLGQAVFTNVGVGTPGGAPATPTPPADATCPAGWGCQDIGNLVPTGGETLNNGVWSLQGAGRDIAGAYDQFRYAWQTFSGNGSVSAQIISQTNTNPLAKAGLMLRGSADPAAPFYGAFLTPGQGLTVLYRLGQGAFIRTASTITATAPLYVRVNRSGSAGATFSTDTSSNGVTWTHVSGSTATMPNLGAVVQPALLGGLAVTARNSGLLSSAQFSGVTFTGAIVAPTATPTPTLSPVSGTPTPPTATPTPSGPLSGTYSGSIAATGGSGSFTFTPGASGPATVGACAVTTGAVYTVALYDSSNNLIGSGGSSSYCNWVDTTLNAGQRYTVTTTAVSGSGVYRAAWNVNGAPVVWNLAGPGNTISTPGGSQSVSFPILSTGYIALSTCGPAGSNFDLSLTSAGGTTLASGTSPSNCESVSYQPGARGLYRLVETAVSGAGQWSGSITTELSSPPSTPTPAPTNTPAIPTNTPTLTPTATSTPAPTNTPTPTATATSTPTPVPTNTPTPAPTATPTPSGPLSGTYSGSIAGPGGSSSFTFRPGASGSATVGSCAITNGYVYSLAVYDSHNSLLNSAANSATCNWVTITVSAGQTYTATTTDISGSGVYRAAWNVNGAPVVWNLTGSGYSINTVGGSQSMSFPILSAGQITLSTCGPAGSNFDLYLNSAGGSTLASGTSSSNCESISYTPSARGLFRLVETSVSGSGLWSGTMTTQ